MESDPTFTLCGRRASDVELRTLAPQLVTCERCRIRMDASVSDRMIAIRQLGLFGVLALVVLGCASREHPDPPVYRVRPAAELLCEPREPWELCFARLQAVAPPRGAR